MENITLQQLCNVSNSVLVKGENHHWYDEVFEKGFIHFINQNNGEQFCLPTDATPNSYVEDGCEFTLPNSYKTVWIEFYKHTPITKEDL